MTEIEKGQLTTNLTTYGTPVAIGVLIYIFENPVILESYFGPVLAGITLAAIGAFLTANYKYKRPNNDSYQQGYVDGFNSITSDDVKLGTEDIPTIDDK